MLSTDISESRKLASLSSDALNLFFFLIPHFNSHGKMNGQPAFIQGQCVPLVTRFTIDKIAKCLAEISEKTNVKWFKHNGLYRLHSLNWQEHQTLRGDRLGPDLLPNYDPAGVVPDNSRSSPGVVPLEVEGKVEVEDQGEGEVEGCGETADPVVLIVAYLNKKTGKNFQATTKETVRLIKKQIRENHRTIQDFYSVIDVKTAEWLNDPKWNKYLCPDTLFGENFEKYLNQTPVKTRDEQAVDSLKVMNEMVLKENGHAVIDIQRRDTDVRATIPANTTGGNPKNLFLPIPRGEG
jgi:uncharacterized phage protein (TIGR02220 family)